MVRFRGKCLPWRRQAASAGENNKAKKWASKIMGKEFPRNFTSESARRLVGN